MGFFGGSSQSSSQLTSSINFNPVIQLGDDNNSDSNQKADQTATQTPTQKDELAASVGFLGGTAGPAGVSDATGTTDPQPITTKSASTTLGSISPFAIGAVALAGGMLLMQSKGKK